MTVDFMPSAATSLSLIAIARAGGLCWLLPMTWVAWFATQPAPVPKGVELVTSVLPGA